MPGTKKPRKKYVGRADARWLKKIRQEPWRLTQLFAQIDRLMDAIDNDGMIDRKEDGTAVFFCRNDQSWWPLDGCLAGVCDAMDIHTRRHGLPEIAAPLRALVERVARDEELEQVEIDAAHASIREMRRIFGEMTIDYASKLASDCDVKFMIEDRMKVA